MGKRGEKKEIWNIEIRRLERIKKVRILMKGQNSPDIWLTEVLKKKANVKEQNKH